ncbi:MAG: hypothetical protein HQL34_02395 [Alphaproteobacteria bacterium]|nr:hypothetical protein [Alphaproteobacteria bacterium]
MVRYWIFDGDTSRVFLDGEPWEHPETGVKYGRGDNLLRELPGRREVAETPRPEGVRVLGSSVEMIGGVPTQVWATEPLPPPTPDEVNAPILRELAELDARSIRPLRAMLAAQASGRAADQRDVDTLADLGTRTDALRARLVKE